MKITDRVIVALDVPSLREARALIELLPEVNFWKVGLECFVNSGTEILKILKAKEKRIFLDLKFHDIPNTVVGACQSAANFEVDLLTIHSTCGKVALKAAKEALSDYPSPPKLVAITLLTSLNSRELAIDLKIPLELPEYILNMALLAKESGLDGAVCSPQEATNLKNICGQNFILVCPGIRPISTSIGDQKRVMTPVQAFKAGADYLVIGRPITQVSNPLEAWHKLTEELGEIS